MAQHTYQHPHTGATTSIGKDDELIAQGWEREYDADNQCVECGAHIADPHSPNCTKGE